MRVVQRAGYSVNVGHSESDPVAISNQIKNDITDLEFADSTLYTLSSCADA